jgi:hypothetical protein
VVEQDDIELLARDFVPKFSFQPSKKFLIISETHDFNKIHGKPGFRETT